jgi:hypothetical protein
MRRESVPEQAFLRGMVATRLLSGSIEITAALLMWRFGRLDTAVRINGLLGLVGPLVLTLTMLMGVAGLAGRLPLSKLLWIGLGVVLILFGTSR